VNGFTPLNIILLIIGALLILAALTNRTLTETVKDAMAGNFDGLKSTFKPGVKIPNLRGDG